MQLGEFLAAYWLHLRQSTQHRYPAWMLQQATKQQLPFSSLDSVIAWIAGM